MAIKKSMDISSNSETEFHNFKLLRVIIGSNYIPCTGLVALLFDFFVICICRPLPVRSTENPINDWKGGYKPPVI